MINYWVLCLGSHHKEPFKKGAGAFFGPLHYLAPTRPSPALTDNFKRRTTKHLRALEVFTLEVFIKWNLGISRVLMRPFKVANINDPSPSSSPTGNPHQSPPIDKEACKAKPKNIYNARLQSVLNWESAQYGAIQVSIHGRQ